MYQDYVPWGGSTQDKIQETWSPQHPLPNLTFGLELEVWFLNDKHCFNIYLFIYFISLSTRTAKI